MLNNLKLVLLEHKKFLTIFFLVIFVPSIILAIFGIRAINNERYKLQQISLEQQRGFVKALKAEIQSQIENELSGLREFSASRALLGGDNPAFSTMVSGRFLEGSIRGQIVIWNGEEAPWFPGLMDRPLSNRGPVFPSEWRLFQSDIERAERAEFRLGNISEAVSIYRGILQRAKDEQARAWILSRLARCQIKNKNYDRALEIRRSLIDDYPDSITETGRPLGIVSRMELLDILLADHNVSEFFQESIRTFESLEERFWSVDGNQIQIYLAMLLERVNEALNEDSVGGVPTNYRSSIENNVHSLQSQLKIWRTAEAVKHNLLPDIRTKMSGSPDSIPDLQKNVLEIEGQELLVLLLSLDRHMPGSDFEFLGSILEFESLREPIETFISSNIPPDISILIRSSRVNDVLYGEEKTEDRSPLLSDFFPENFPPWKVEVYPNEGVGPGVPLHKNIFFWIILALLVIVFFGSGLITRTIVQEVNLLNLKSEFIASVSHEFKTPLTAMGAILERLMSDEVKDSQKRQEYYRILSHDSEKLKRLVKNVLDFTKIEEGKREYKLKETDIARLVRSEVASFQKENKMAGFDLEIEIEDEIPKVNADEEALSQAIHNILDNAAKFSGSEKTIEVKVTNQRDSVEIAVLDRGVGIAEDEQKKVFDKFYRGKNASSVSPTGTGLGLTLVKHIMDGHGGRVVIRSHPRKGSRVSLLLPLAEGG